MYAARTTVRFGLVGADNIGKIRARALQNIPGCELTAIADLDIERARAAASTGITIFADYQRMLASDIVDAVVVSTPPQSHKEVVTTALDAGKHVLCEKPLSNSVKAAQRMVETSRRSGKTLASGFNFRYIPAVQYLKQTLDSGLIGELDHVRGFAGHVGLSEFKAPWEYDKKVVGGGALMDIGIHMIDLVRYILGDVAEVFGVATGNIWKLDGSEDNGFALMRNPQGKTGTLHATWSEWKGYRFQIEVYGNQGMIQAQYGPMRNTLIYMGQPGGQRHRKSNFYPMTALQEKLHGWQWSIERSFRLELADFARLTQGKNSTIADGFAGFRAVEIANAIYRSNQEKRPVQLVEPF
jgi:predicted dehydrogenase